MRALTKCLVALTALGLLATGCSEDSSGAGSADAFDGVSVTVGSKNFVEQYVLSEILLQGLAARGATVTDLTDTGDTATTRTALLNGEIDTYWEYNSTGWVEHLGQASPPDPDGEQLTENVRAADKSANQIEWLDRSSFNDSYGFAVGPSIAEDTSVTRFSVEAFNLQAMAEYLDDNADSVVCVEPEFVDRADGLILFETHTGYTIPDSQMRVFDNAGDVYEATATGECSFGEVFTTDGRIDAFDLTNVIDSGVFYVYNVSLNISTSLYDQAPDAFDDLVSDILKPMSQTRITELNRRVSDGETVAAVAADYLKTFGINP